MSGFGDCFLSQDQVNKRILARETPVHCPHELLGPFDLYRSENTEAYLSRKEEFMRVASEMREQNRNALVKRFSKNETFQCVNERDEPPVNSGAYVEALSVRKRSERHIHEVTEIDVGVCCIERWFVRHLYLNKFVKAARNAIIRNRLLKQLELLKTLDRDMVDKLEQLHVKYNNVSYASLFEKFL